LFETGAAGTLALFAGYVSFETLNSFASIRLIYAPERARSLGHIAVGEHVA
jgi:hypothetical protein